MAVRKFETVGGARIYQIPLEAFPGMWGHVYLVLLNDHNADVQRVLIDTGSGFGEANQQLEMGLQEVSAIEGRPIGLADLTHILITHAHIDHFGGLSYIRPRSHARLGVHELDRRNLTNYEERLLVASHRLKEFLIEAGVSPDRIGGLIEMYQMTKVLFHSVEVDFTYEAIGMRLGPFEMLHVPGHCPGQVVIRLHDVLFSGDHVLEEISPHQSPEQLTQSTGLDHYLNSLNLVRPWAREVHLTLGGHKAPIIDLEARLDAIYQLHMERLQQVLDILREPHTVSEVSHALFRDVHGYNVLLALEEAGAHVEYLYQRGQLEIVNLDEFGQSIGPTPICYRCIECGTRK